jgi:hypothetical protein
MGIGSTLGSVGMAPPTGIGGSNIERLEGAIGWIMDQYAVEYEWLTRIFDLAYVAPGHVLLPNSFIARFEPPLGFQQFVYHQSSVPPASIQPDRSWDQRMADRLRNLSVSNGTNETPTFVSTTKYAWDILSLSIRQFTIPHVGLDIIEKEIGTGRVIKVPIAVRPTWLQLESRFTEILYPGLPSPLQIWRWWNEWYSGFFVNKSQQGQEWDAQKQIQDPAMLLDALWVVKLYVLQGIIEVPNWLDNLLNTTGNITTGMGDLAGGMGLIQRDSKMAEAFSITGQLVRATRDTVNFYKWLTEGNTEKYKTMLREKHLFYAIPYPETNIPISYTSEEIMSFTVKWRPILSLYMYNPKGGIL